MIAKIKEMLLSSWFIVTRAKKLNPHVWIFSSSYNNKFNYNSKYLFEYVFEHLVIGVESQNNPHPEAKQTQQAQQAGQANLPAQITPLFVINDPALRAKLNQEFAERYQARYGHAAPHDFFISTKNRQGMLQVLRAGVWFTSAGLPVYQGLRHKGRVVVNLWHGVPLKKIALLEEEINWQQKLFFKFMFSRIYTHVLTTSQALVPIMAKSFAVAETRVKAWGQPRNDALLRNTQAFNLAEHYYNATGQQLPSCNKAVLYAPTYREYEPTKLFPFADMNEQQLGDFLASQQMLLFIRCHQSEQTKLQLKHPRVIALGSDILGDINQALSFFDVLVTDYSSIYIDYLLLGKPMLFLPYDQHCYLRRRGLNFNYDEVTPGPKPSTLTQFISELTQLVQRDVYYRTERDRVNTLLNGRPQLSCPRIVAEVMTTLGLPGNDKSINAPTNNQTIADQDYKEHQA